MLRRTCVALFIGKGENHSWHESYRLLYLTSGSMTSRMRTVTVMTCLFLIFLLLPCEGIPTSRDHAVNSPDTLLHVALAAEATSIHVTWAVQPPVDHTGEYKVTWVDQHERQGNTYVADKLETVIDGLKPCTQYTVLVTRVHKTGQITTDKVERSTITHNEAPPAVTGLLTRDIAARSIVLTWERPATACKITAYRVIYEGVAKWAPHNAHKNTKSIRRGEAENATRFTVDDLQPYSDYTLMVVAYTSRGKGRSANVTFTTEQDVPGMPVDIITKEPTATSIAVLWQKPDVTNGVLGPYYVSWYRDGERMGSERDSLTAITIVGLSPCVEYTIHVAASTAAGVGDYKAITQMTVAAAPPATSDIACHSNDDRSVMMTWTKPDTACLITSYKVTRPRSSFDVDNVEVVEVGPTVLSANFSTQTGTNFRACVTATVSESLLGSQTCCDQDTLKVHPSESRDNLYYIIAICTLVVLVIILVIALAVVRYWKKKPIQQDVLNPHHAISSNSPAPGAQEEHGPSYEEASLTKNQDQNNDSSIYQPNIIDLYANTPNSEEQWFLCIIS